VTPDPPSSSPQARPESREIVELRQLRAASPHLASAIDLQIAVLETQRLVQTRVPLPRIYGKDDLLASRLRGGRRLIEFDEIAFDWSDARRLVRDAADLLKRFELVEDAEAVAMTALVRDAAALPAFLRTWYDLPLVDAATPRDGLAASPGAGQVCLVAMRPYLARCAAAVQSSLEQLSQPTATCPVCAGEPDFTVWSLRGRQLVCSRCTARWLYPDDKCALCGEERAAARRSFASQSRTYRVEACNTCRRYLKGFDERRATRPLILSVDTIATLPLDAAAIQMGFE
jgi:formate dehydrogenase maturation protein FdhE